MREELETEIINKDQQLQDLLKSQAELTDELKSLNTSELETRQENIQLTKSKVTQNIPLDNANN